MEIRGTFQAYINIGYGLGSACGATFGGYLCDTLGWRWAFGVQIPPIAVAIAIAIFAVPTGLGPCLMRTSEKSIWSIIAGFDLLGSLLLCTAVAFLILFLNLGGNVYSWQHPIVIASGVIFLIALPLLLFVESRAALPVMPLKMLFTKPRGNLVFHNFFSNVGINTVIFNAPLYFQVVKQESPSMSGFRLAVPAASLTVVAVTTGFFITYSGRMFLPQLAGSISMLIGAVCLSSMWDGIPLWLATLFVVPPSMGQGFAFPATSIAVLATSTQAEQAVMTTTLGLWRSIGTILGVAISSLILQNALVAYLEGFVTGQHKADIISAVRRSVRVIGDLTPHHRLEVIRAYEAALRITFISTIVLFVIVNLLLIPVKLPKLGRRRSVAGVDP